MVLQIDFMTSDSNSPRPRADRWQLLWRYLAETSSKCSFYLEYFRLCFWANPRQGSKMGSRLEKRLDRHQWVSCRVASFVGNLRPCVDDDFVVRSPFDSFCRQLLKTKWYLAKDFRVTRLTHWAAVSPQSAPSTSSPKMWTFVSADDELGSGRTRFSTPKFHMNDNSDIFPNLDMKTQRFRRYSVWLQFWTVGDIPLQKP